MEFLSGDNYDKSEEELCSVLFDDLSVIGVGSLCRFDEDRLILSIELGDSPTFLKEDPLNFKGGVLRAYYCV